MTDETDQTAPAEHDAVRRLLDQARHDEPIPVDVAARLDRVLAGLSNERTEAPADVEVIPLELHRRRRAAGLLVAAAAIVVAGVAVAQHLASSSSTPTSASPAAGTDDGLTTNSGNGAPSLAQTPHPQPELQGSSAKTRAGRLVVRPRHFTADALAGLRVVDTAQGRRLDSLKVVSRGCVPSLGNATLVPATYEKAPAALVYHAAAGTTQVVDLYICGSAKPVRSVTLPTP
ncbi:MAG: hypothetical protein QOH37_925 [Nocardioidaceae bacterium]|nr:hypothetical protein [Nocardioidaceae bacterium]